MDFRAVSEVEWDGIAIGIGGRGRDLDLAKPHAAGDRSAIRVDPVVGDFDVVIPTVGVDAAARLAIAEAHAINARRGAVEIGRVIKAKEVRCAEQRRKRRYQLWRDETRKQWCTVETEGGNARAFFCRHKGGFDADFKGANVQVPALRAQLRGLVRQGTICAARWRVRR